MYYYLTIFLKELLHAVGGPRNKNVLYLHSYGTMLGQFSLPHAKYLTEIQF